MGKKGRRGKKGRNEGRKAGRKEGRKEGMKEGMKDVSSLLFAGILEMVENR